MVRLGPGWPLPVTESLSHLVPVLKKVKHRLVENMSSGTADALGLSRAILCNGESPPPCRFAPGDPGSGFQGRGTLAATKPMEPCWPGPGPSLWGPESPYPQPWRPL